MISQVMIAVLGVAAIFLSQHSDLRVRRWSSVFGLASQPFWYYAAWTGEQWGIFVLSFFYTAAFMYGFYNNWIKK